MNSVNLIGRIARDPELKSTPNGTAVVKFSIAVDSFKKDDLGETKADFFDCEAWSKTAEFISQYFAKGSKIALTGRLAQETWTSHEGQNRSKVKIVAERCDFCEKKAEGQEPRSTKPKTVVEDEDDGHDPFADE